MGKTKPNAKDINEDAMEVDSPKTLHVIAQEIDDFLLECSPRGNKIDFENSVKVRKAEEATMKVQDSVQDCFNYDLSNEGSPVKVLREIFSFYEQIQGVSVADEIDEVSLMEESEILDKTIEALTFSGGENYERWDDKHDIDLKKIQTDFLKYKQILKDTISTVFKNNADEVSQLLGELIKREFSQDQEDDYFNLSTEQYSDDAVNALVTMGVVEFHKDDDTQIRLVKLNC